MFQACELALLLAACGCSLSSTLAQVPAAGGLPPHIECESTPRLRLRLPAVNRFPTRPVCSSRPMCPCASALRCPRPQDAHAHGRHVCARTPLSQVRLRAFRRTNSRARECQGTCRCRVNQEHACVNEAMNPRYPAPAPLFRVATGLPPPPHVAPPDAPCPASTGPPHAWETAGPAYVPSKRRGETRDPRPLRRNAHRSQYPRLTHTAASRHGRGRRLGREECRRQGRGYKGKEHPGRAFAAGVCGATTASGARVCTTGAMTKARGADLLLDRDGELDHARGGRGAGPAARERGRGDHRGVGKGGHRRAESEAHDRRFVAKMAVMLWCTCCFRISTFATTARCPSGPWRGT